MPSRYWRDEYLSLRASIDGVEFQLVDATTTLGRRTAVQKLADDESGDAALVVVPDMGAGEHELQIEGYLIGTDYHLKRARLERVFETPGAKTLVHPYRGQLRVGISGKLRIQESKAQGGRCSISFACVRLPPTDATQPTTSAADEAASAADGARSTARAALASQVSGLDRDRPLDAFRRSLVHAQAALRGAYNAVQGALSTVDDVLGPIDALTSDVDALLLLPLDALNKIGDLTRLVVGAPLRTAETTRFVVETLSDGRRVATMLGIASFLRSKEAGELAALSEGGLSAPPTGSDSDDVAASKNAQAVVAMMRVEIATSLVETLVEHLPESRAQAKEALEEILAALVGMTDGSPDALLYAVDDETREALVKLRTAAVNHLSASAINLPELRTYTPTAELSAIMLAHLIHGDARRWEELAIRNDIAHPLFVPATPIEYVETR